MNEAAKNTKSTRRIVICAMMIAITLIMSYTPIGMIPLGTVSATISHVPAIITAILLGPLEGVIVGTAFGIITLFKALTSPAGILDPLFVNPIISVLPRALIGLTTGYSYIGLKKLKDKFKGADIFAIAVSGCIGSMTNTIFVMGLIYFIYGKDLIAMLAVENLQAVRVLVIATITGSGIIEMIVAAIITTIVAKGIKTALHL